MSGCFPVTSVKPNSINFTFKWNSFITTYSMAVLLLHNVFFIDNFISSETKIMTLTVYERIIVYPFLLAAQISDIMIRSTSIFLCPVILDMVVIMGSLRKEEQGLMPESLNESQLLIRPASKGQFLMFYLVCAIASFLIGWQYFFYYLILEPGKITSMLRTDTGFDWVLIVISLVVNLFHCLATITALSFLVAAFQRCLQDDRHELCREADTAQLKNTINWMLCWKWELTALNFFTINRRLVTGVFAVLVTYVVKVDFMEIVFLGPKHPT
ncbi:unnamed protein product [Allacma fusca]|uniref:Gustatory receptor n=1 Tax=Allacma fusca TaxID=39272 RepID=A0A8J2JML7_9HEXA|nr:unnamed protein product [Allacma fusca]